MNEELIAFAEEVRRQSVDILCSIEPNPKKALALAEALTIRAATVKNQEKMKVEVSAPNRYDLTTLPAPIAVHGEDDPESPDFEA